MTRDELKNLMDQVMTVDDILLYAQQQGVTIPKITIQQACQNSQIEKPYGVQLIAIKKGRERRGVWLATRVSVEKWVAQYQQKRQKTANNVLQRTSKPAAENGRYPSLKYVPNFRIIV